jgi:glycogen debranching enzyme
MPNIETIPDNIPDAAEALNSLLSHEGVYASGDVLYNNAVFGRDSLEVAEDVMETRPDIAKRVITTLAALQGTEYNALSEEEPGRIHHEHRSINIGDTAQNPDSLRIMQELVETWGGDENSMTYYGSVDATPLFVKVVDSFCHHYDDEILTTAVTNKDGQEITIGQSFERAVDWIESHVASSPLGLVEFKRVNPLGIKNQVWKDSEEFYVHADGTEVTSSVASIEVQGLAYDALIAAAERAERDRIPEKAAHYKELANNIQGKVMDLWLDDEQYFALGYDYDDNNNTRFIKTCTANPAALLNTTIFDNLPEQDRQKYIGAIVQKILSSDFLTDAGIRSRALHHEGLVPIWDYHGTFVTWPKETYDVAKGLRRQGFEELSEQLESRIMNLFRLARNYPEFVYVDKSGTLLINKSMASESVEIIGSNTPERLQAWSVSAALAIKNRQPLDHPPRHWQADLTRHIIATMPLLSEHIQLQTYKLTWAA